VPVVTVVVDTPTRIRDWFGIVAEMTDEVGLVTSEMVPAFRSFPSDHGPEALPLAALGGGR
jgi:hypothetical protein